MRRSTGPFLACALSLLAVSVGQASAPQLSVDLESGQLAVRVSHLPAGAQVEIAVRSDRNTAISHSAEVSPHDPRALTAEKHATYWYPVVDLALEPDLAALARFDSGSAGRVTINGMVRPDPRPLAADLRLTTADLLQWENTLAVEPKAELRDFALLATAPVRDGVATRAFRPLTPGWRGQVEARITFAPNLAPLVLRAPAVATAPAAANADPLITLRGDGLSPARLQASLQASLGFLLRMQDLTPGSPTRGGLNLFYDHAARTFRRPHWIWSNGPAVKLLLDAARDAALAGEHDPARLRRVAREIGEATRRFQLRLPGNPADGIVVSRWREAEGRLAQNGGFDQFYSVADALFLVGWAWVPLARETGDQSWLEAGERVAAATERLLGQFDLIPMDYLFPPGEWKNWTIDEAGFAPEGLAALFAATGREQLRKIGHTYMTKLTARFEQPDGRWARRIDFQPERVLLTPRVTRGVGWAMEGLLANYELTQERRWLEKAIRLAAHLQAAQQPDGAWAFEYDQPVAKVGVGEKATALWSLLFYRLHRHTGDPAHLAAARRALGWCLNNQYTGPDRDGHGGIAGLNVQSGVTYRPWFPLACAYTSAFFGLAVLEELHLPTAVATAPRPAAELRFFGASPGALAAVRTRLTANDATLRPALEKLMADADQALAISPPSVTHKTRLPPSGDRHDYMSTGPYWWPDPSKPDGLPYIQRDGRVNPEGRTAASDQARVETLGRTIETLALAYWFTAKPAYAEHAARCLRVWFLDPATKMNPNFEYAQGVPGRNTGRGIGLIEAGGLVEAIDASALLAGSRAWTAQDAAALHAWGAAFLHWMLTSQHGRDEAATRNNHGTMYDVRVARLALALDRTDLARSILEAAKTRRIAAQIEPDGRQPHELARTKSFSYSRLNLGGLVALATLGTRVGVDLWHFQTADGRSLRQALDYLAPYVRTPPAPWPHEQIAGVDRASFAAVFRQAALAYRDSSYADIVAQLPGAERARFQLLHPAP